MDQRSGPASPIEHAPAPDADGVVALLGLSPHPEGGWFAESFRDAASSAIWFLLRSGEASHWHRVVDAAEVWHHYLGDPLCLQTSADGATVRTVTLGDDLAGGHRPQAVVAPGEWQAATPVPGGRCGFTLVGCTVAPPFRFDAFELAPHGWSPSDAGTPDRVERPRSPRA